MKPLSIRRVPDPILKEPTKHVERIDGNVAALIEQLIKLMRAQRRCVGLAAPQVGSSLQIAVMDGTGHPKVPVSHGLLVLVNPTIIHATGTWVSREGCLSVPDFTGIVRRAVAIDVKAFDVYGTSQEHHLEGFEAVIAQHEIDHLHGKLFLDRIENVKTDVFRRKDYGKQ